MLKSLCVKLKEAAFSVLPVTSIVFLLNLFTPLVNYTRTEMTVFLIASALMILGIALFNLGADLAMTPMGENIGSGLTRTKKMWLLLSVCFAFGLLVTVAEPDLSVLASQVSDVIDPTLLVMSVGVGVGAFLVFAVVKIVTRSHLSNMIAFFYMLIFAIVSIALLRSRAFMLPLAFDSGGVTTGPVTVPFIMALGVGIATTLGGKNVGENSFGLVSLCSIGPIISVLALSLFSSGKLDFNVPDYSVESKLGEGLFRTLGSVAKEVAAALLLVVVFFFALQLFVLKLPKKRILQIVVGIIYTFFGLVVFLTAVNIGFMPIGYKLGNELVTTLDKKYIIIAGFILGAVTVLAEPAVHVLNRQVETVTNGMVKRRSVLAALSAGVGISIALSVVRIVYDFDILYVLVPGYLISIGLSLFVPGIYTAIAFDSGGVASGPLTSGFILPFSIGVCYTLQGREAILRDGFGIVALVALTPLITIQLLGFKAVLTRKIRHRIALKRILSADDEQIINF